MDLAGWRWRGPLRYTCRQGSGQACPCISTLQPQHRLIPTHPQASSCPLRRLRHTGTAPSINATHWLTHS